MTSMRSQTILLTTGQLEDLALGHSDLSAQPDDNNQPDAVESMDLDLSPQVTGSCSPVHSSHAKPDQHPASQMSLKHASFPPNRTVPQTRVVLSVVHCQQAAKWPPK